MVIKSLLIVLSMLVLVPPCARAEGPIELTITPEKIEAAPDYLTQVVAPDASCAAVNDALSLLVVGSKAEGAQQLAVFKLDAAGKPGEPVWLKLPKPDTLAAKPNYPLGVLFHPRLPILYVWQDVDAPPVKGEKQPLPAEYQEFDHLLVYSIKDGALELVQSTASGDGFRCGFKAGTIGFDFGEKNLFVPNAAGASADEAGIAFYALDDEGLPSETAEESRDQPGKKVTNLTTAKGSKKVIRPVLLPKKLHTAHYYPSGTGWVAGSDALIMGGYSGCMVADFHNGGLRQTWFSIPILTGSCSVAGHPTLPALYMVLFDHNHIYQIGQANGVVSLLPQIAAVTGTHLSGLPVILTKQSRMAVTEAKSLHLIGLKPDGKFDGQDQMLSLPGGVGKGLAYSEKLGRLFVAVDKAN